MCQVYQLVAVFPPVIWDLCLYGFCLLWCWLTIKYWDTLIQQIPWLVLSNTCVSMTNCVLWNKSVPLNLNKDGNYTLVFLIDRCVKISPSQIKKNHSIAYGWGSAVVMSDMADILTNFMDSRSADIHSPLKMNPTGFFDAFSLNQWNIFFLDGLAQTLGW